MDELNRMAALVRPKKPFLNWVISTPELDVSDSMTLDQLREDCTILLVPDLYSPEDVQAWLHSRKPEIFELELEGWTDDEGLWPQDRSAEIFDQWFDLEIHSFVFDMADESIYRDGDEEYDDELLQGLLWTDKEQEVRIEGILEGVDLEDPDAGLDAWLAYLGGQLSFPFDVEVVEYGGGAGLSAGDRVSVIAVAGANGAEGIQVKVQKSEQELLYPLYKLQVVDESSDNYQPVEDYSVWFNEW
jgi:hypothetical protein